MWAFTLTDGKVLDQAVSDLYSTTDSMSHYEVKVGDSQLNFSVSVDLYNNGVEFRRFARAASHYRSYTRDADVDNVFPLDVQSCAVAIEDLCAGFAAACELAYFCMGSKNLCCGPFAEQFAVYAEQVVVSRTEVLLPCIVDETPSSSVDSDVLPPLSLTIKEGDIMGIEGGYVQHHAALGGYNPFAPSDIPVGQRAVTTVMKMASVNATETHFVRNAYQCYLENLPVGSPLDLEDSEVFGETLQVYACRQRFVTWCCMQFISQRNPMLRDYWNRVRNDGLMRKMTTYTRYAKGLDYMREAIDKYLPPSRANACKHDREKAILRSLMSDSYLPCPKTRKGKGFVNDDLLFHFESWNKKDRKNMNSAELNWPLANFSLFSRCTPSIGNFDVTIESVRAELEHWRKCRAVFLVPDFFGKFASLDTMCYGKSFSVLMKWRFLGDLYPGRYDLYGVGSENYFLSALSKATRVEGLRETKSNIVVQFFDNDPKMVERFFYAQSGNVLDPRPANYIVSDAEIDYSPKDLGLIFSRAGNGVAMKFIARNANYGISIRTFVSLASSRKWNYWVQRCGDLYNGEIIMIAGKWKLTESMANVTLNGLAEQIADSIREGEHNRRKCLMMFILGVPFSNPLRNSHLLYAKMIQMHKSFRNFCVSSSRATSTYLKNY